MAKKKGLHISKVNLEKIIQEFANIRKSECKNTVNNQTRYYLDKDGVEFYIDVYFKADNTLTTFPMKTGDNKELSEKLVSIIQSCDEYPDVTSGTFSCAYDITMFNALKSYLSDIDGVTKTKDEDKKQNGQVVQFTSEIGDKITLTYYQTTGRMFFQGLLLKLYIEVKSFISPSIGNIRTEMRNTVGQAIEYKNREIDKFINTFIPNAYNSSNDIIKGFICDSFTLLIANNTLSDYSPYTFPILKALEFRIKQILKYEQIYIDDTKGFKYLDINGKWVNIFRHDGRCYKLDNALASKFTKDTAESLIKCYTYLNANRHTIFHTKQEITATRVLKTSDEAKVIIIEVCDLFEESLKKLGK